MMNKKDDFSALLGDKQNIKKAKQQSTSSQFYRAKTPVKRRPVASETTFKPASISQQDYDIGTEDKLAFHRPNIPHNLLTKLGKGEFTVCESIDLHGMTTTEAEIYIANTINHLREQHMHCIRIVHGKGYHAQANDDDTRLPKLKNFTARYLAAHERVLAYTSCPKNRGGTGAVYVLISRFDK